MCPIPDGNSPAVHTTVTGEHLSQLQTSICTDANLQTNTNIKDISEK